VRRSREFTSTWSGEPGAPGAGWLGCSASPHRRKPPPAVGGSEEDGSREGASKVAGTEDARCEIDSSSNEMTKHGGIVSRQPGTSDTCTPHHQLASTSGLVVDMLTIVVSSRRDNVSGPFGARCTEVPTCVVSGGSPVSRTHTQEREMTTNIVRVAPGCDECYRRTDRRAEQDRQTTSR